MGLSLLVPEALAFAAAIPVVILFYLLKRKRQVKLVSSTLLWERFLAETQASKPFQRLRHNWLLVLQLLLVLAVVLALSRPWVPGPGKASKLRIVILDASASMQATDVKPSRFEQARAEALRLVGSLGDVDQMVVLQAGAHTEVKQSATSDKTALRRALAGCAPADAPTRLTEALKLAETLIQNRAEAEIHLFSDGAVPDLSEFENKNLPLVYHCVGRGGRNAGLVALEVRPHPDDPTQRAVFAAVANGSTNPEPVQVELLFEGRLLESRPVTLPATNTLPMVFMAPQDQDGVFTVRLRLEDDLAADNQASIVSLLPQPVKVLLVSRGNRFLEKALKAPGYVQLTAAPALADAAEGFDLVVLDDVYPAVWPAPNLLAIHLAPTNWFVSVGTVTGPVIVDWKTTHSLLRFVNFDNVQIAEALKVPTPDWAVPLVESPDTPLVLAGQRQRQRIIWIGFDLLQSTWPLRLSFPIFIANAVEWLNPAASAAAGRMVRAGEPFRWVWAQPVSSAELIGPDGRARPVSCAPGSSELVIGDTARQGIYRLKAGTNEVTFCVNLLDSAESRIDPQPELPLGKYARVTATTMSRAGLELWPGIAAAALGLLLLEWWFYHRRTV
jgi:hypothetical protein